MYCRVAERNFYDRPQRFGIRISKHKVWSCIKASYSIVDLLQRDSLSSMSAPRTAITGKLNCTNFFFLILSTNLSLANVCGTLGMRLRPSYCFLGPWTNHKNMQYSSGRIATPHIAHVRNGRWRDPWLISIESVSGGALKSKTQTNSFSAL